jgi:hypothetical protein
VWAGVVPIACFWLQFACVPFTDTEFGEAKERVAHVAWNFTFEC